jgi:hypothetical protein
MEIILAQAVVRLTDNSRVLTSDNHGEWAVVGMTDNSHALFLSDPGRVGVTDPCAWTYYILFTGKRVLSYHQ